MWVINSCSYKYLAHYNAPLNTKQIHRHPCRQELVEWASIALALSLLCRTSNPLPAPIIFPLIPQAAIKTRSAPLYAKQHTYHLEPGITYRTYSEPALHPLHSTVCSLNNKTKTPWAANFLNQNQRNMRFPFSPQSGSILRRTIFIFRKAAQALWPIITHACTHKAQLFAPS